MMRGRCREKLRDITTHVFRQAVHNVCAQRSKEPVLVAANTVCSSRRRRVQYFADGNGVTASVRALRSVRSAALSSYWSARRRWATSGV